MFKIAGSLTFDEPMAAHTSFRIGGTADLFITPAGAADAVEVLRRCAEHSLPLFVLGGGTNLLVSDRGIRGVVLDLSRLTGIRAEGNRLTAHAGTPISDVAEFALRQGLSGLEFAYALPGSVGGAVWMNARCYGSEVSDVLEGVDYLQGPPYETQHYRMNRADWDYKKSPFQDSGRIVLSASFLLSRGEPAPMEERMKSFRTDREKKGHFLHPCAGSVFKNNRSFGAPSGRLIDSLGLKGTRMGDAQVAPFHGNIFINIGAARAADMRALMERVEAEVHSRLGFRLEREVILVGEWD